MMLMHISPAPFSLALSLSLAVPGYNLCNGCAKHLTIEVLTLWASNIRMAKPWLRHKSVDGEG